MHLLGIDNIFFQARDIEKAISFYQNLGFQLKFRIPQIPGALFHIGEEEPGLILCKAEEPKPSRLWIEVENKEHVKKHCASMDIQGKEIETKTGSTFEVKDSDGNIIGFADYSKQPALGRSKNSAKSVAKEYANRVWDDKDLKAIDDLVDKNAVIHGLLGDFHGPAAMKTVVQAWLKGFPDLNVSNDLVICENNLVSIQWNAKGTHSGEFKGRNPTGKTVSYNGATVYRIKDGKIVEYWAYLDMQYLLSQL